MRIIFVSPVPEEGASYRYRVKQFIPFLERKGVLCTERPFLFPQFYRIAYRPANSSLKMAYLLKSSFCRFIDTLNIKKYDIIFIHRESFPVGPAIFEDVVRLTGRPIIYDFDDAIYLRSPYTTSEFNKLRILKCYKNVRKAIKISAHTIVSNKFLQNYALQFNKRVSIIPTCVDTEKFIINNRKSANKAITIGWIGSYTTSSYLGLLSGVFQRLAKKYDFMLKIVGAGKKIAFPGVKIENLEWSLEKDVENFQSIDIGVYPLVHDEWSRGKIGFKPIQYMSVGVPCVASYAGNNMEIIQEGVNGFLARSDNEWLEKISLLIENPHLRGKIGLAGRITVEENYSVKANAPKFLKVIHEAGNAIR